MSQEERCTPYVWDIQNEEHKTEIISAAVKMTDLCQGIAQELGPGWSFGGLSDEYGSGADLRYQFEDILHLRRDGDFHPKTRVCISGNYPRFMGREVIYSCDNGGSLPSRSCAVSRGAKAIARDIKSYLLADILALREKGREIVKAYTEDRETKSNQIGVIATVFGEDPPEMRREAFACPKLSFGSYPKIHGSIEVQGQDYGIKLEVSRLPYAIALRLADVLQEAIERSL